MNNMLFHYVIRNLAKYTYKFLHPNSYKHNRRYWPFYRVIRNEQGHIEKVFYRKQLVAEQSTAITPTHPTCVLVATGPSSKSIPAQYIDNKDIDFVGMNGAIALTHINFKHYVIIDHDFIQNRFDLVQQVLNTRCNFFTTARCLDEILKKISLQNIQCQIKIIEIMSTGKLERFMGDTLQQHSNHPHAFFDQGFGFSLNYHDFIFDYYTVAYVALQIIFGLNYKTIYMVGVDLNHLNAPRFYETEQNKQPTLLNQHLDEILTAFNTASILFKQKNIEVYNLSESSLVQCFPKKPEEISCVT